MAAVYEGQRTFLSPVLGPVERGIYRLAGVDAKRETGLEALCASRCCSFNVIGFLAVYLLQRLQGVLPLNPQGFGAVIAGLVVQHGRQLRDQHQLAGLRRRDDDELSHADARARRAELPVGRVGHGGAGRADPRLRAPRGAATSATSGSTSRAARSTSCCRCRSCSRSSSCRRASCRASRRTGRSSLVAARDESR